MSYEEPQTGNEEMSTNRFSILPASSTPVGIGNLATLPREIRDEVHGHIWGAGQRNEDTDGEKLIVSWGGSAGKAGLLWDGPNRYSILHVSTSIRREAAESLGSTRTFNIRPYEFTFNNRWHVLDVSFVSHIMNVKVSAPTLHLVECPEILSIFAGTEVPRKTFVVSECSYRLRQGRGSVEITQLPMVEAFKQLTGFKTVTFETAFEVHQGPEWPRERTNAWLGTDPLFHRLRKTLEPALGRSTVRNCHGKETGGKVKIDSTIAFHPHYSLSRKMQPAKKNAHVRGDQMQQVPRATII